MGATRYVNLTAIRNVADAPALSPVGQLALIVVLVGLTAGAYAVGSSGAPATGSMLPTPPPPACPAVGNASVQGRLYWSCEMSLDWGNLSGAAGGFPGGSTRAVEVSLHGVFFRVYGYDTEDCPVVSVTGNESNGSSYSFLIYPAPLNCEFNVPTVLSPDGVFGATWTGGAGVQVLVRIQ